MKINQQLCQKMEQLDQDEDCKVCLMIIYFWQGDHSILAVEIE